MSRLLSGFSLSKVFLVLYFIFTSGEQTDIIWSLVTLVDIDTICRIVQIRKLAVCIY